MKKNTLSHRIHDFQGVHRNQKTVRLARKTCKRFDEMVTDRTQFYAELDIVYAAVPVCDIDPV